MVTYRSAADMVSGPRLRWRVWRSFSGDAAGLGENGECGRNVTLWRWGRALSPLGAQAHFVFGPKNAFGIYSVFPKERRLHFN